MEEKFLLRISLIVLVLGIPLLIMFTNGVEVEEKQVVLSGKVMRSIVTKGITIMSVLPNSTIPVLIMHEENFSKGENVELSGMLKEYKGRIEFVIK